MKATPYFILLEWYKLGYKVREHTSTKDENYREKEKHKIRRTLGIILRNYIICAFLVTNSMQSQQRLLLFCMKTEGEVI